MSVIIFATSAAGKTHFAQHAFGPKGVRVVDGDDTVSSIGGWPKAKDWWKDKQLAADTHRRHVEAFSELFRRNKDLVVVFNTNLPVFVEGLRAALGGDDASLMPQMCFINVSEASIRRNYALRESQIRRGVGGHRSRPIEEYLEGRSRKEQEAKALGLALYPDFSAAAKALKLYVKSGYKR